jgi:hypothetical protein
MINKYWQASPFSAVKVCGTAFCTDRLFADIAVTYSIQDEVDAV